MAKKEYVKNKRGETIYPVTKEDLVFDDNGVALSEKLAEISQTANSAYQKPDSGIPASDIASGVIPDVSNFITASVNNLINYYLKSETYTKAEVNALIGSIQRFSYESVESLPTASANTMGIIYLVPSEDPQTKNVKDEYITLRSGEVGSYTYSWEQIGSTAIDLSGYVTTEALNTELAKYTTTANLTTLLATKQDTISDLATIRSGAAAGATAYQKPGTGIPSTDMASGVQTSLGKADSAYQKPSGGIPKTDLDSGVQRSLDLADSAIQSEPIGSIVPPVNPSEFATKEEVNQLGQEVDGNEFTSFNEGKLSAKYVNNEYVDKNNGNFLAYNGWSRTDYVNISLFKTIKINATVASAYNAFYKKDKSFLSSFALAVGDNTIDIPADASYIVMSTTTVGLSSIVITIDEYRFLDEQDEIALVESLGKSTVNAAKVENSYINSSGNFVTSVNFDAYILRIRRANKVVVKTGGNSNEGGLGVAFFKDELSSNGFISGETLPSGIVQQEYNIPATANYIVVSNRRSVLAEPGISLPNGYIVPSINGSEVTERGGINISGSGWNYNSNVTTKCRTIQDTTLHLLPGDSIAATDGVVFYIGGKTLSGAFFTTYTWQSYITIQEEGDYVLTLRFGTEAEPEGGDITLITSKVTIFTENKEAILPFYQRITSPLINWENTVRSINHRGYCLEAPENTFPAFKLSRKNGFVWVETDVQFSSDNVPVCIHDTTVDRTSNGSGSVNSMTLDQLKALDFGSWFSPKYAGTTIPTLAETLALCRSLGLCIYIELKTYLNSTSAKIILDCIRENGMVGKVNFISSIISSLEAIAGLDNSVRLGYIASVTLENITAIKGIENTYGNAVFMDATNVNSSSAELCLANDIDIEAWTIDNPYTIISTVPAIVCGVTSNTLISGRCLYLANRADAVAH